MHNVINNIIDDSYEKILLDNMSLDLDELISEASLQLEKSDKKRVVIVKVGEMFDVIVVNDITKKLHERFSDKEFILLVNDKIREVHK